MAGLQYSRTSLQYSILFLSVLFLVSGLVLGDTEILKELQDNVNESTLPGF